MTNTNKIEVWSIHIIDTRRATAEYLSATVYYK